MTTKPPSTGESRSRLDPEPVPRRDFLGLAAKVTASAAFLFALLGVLRLPKAAVLPSPTKKFRVSLPDSLQPGEPFIPTGRNVALYRDEDGGVYAISTVCTHLGCIVRAETDGFECPCHGSRYDADGEVTRGPAPRHLDWLEVTGADGGTYIVDEGTVVPVGTREMA